MFHVRVLTQGIAFRMFSGILEHDSLPTSIWRNMIIETEACMLNIFFSVSIYSLKLLSTSENLKHHTTRINFYFFSHGIFNSKLSPWKHLGAPLKISCSTGCFTNDCRGFQSRCRCWNRCLKNSLQEIQNVLQISSKLSIVITLERLHEFEWKFQRTSIGQCQILPHNDGEPHKINHRKIH